MKIPLFADKHVYLNGPDGYAKTETPKQLEQNNLQFPEQKNQHPEPTNRTKSVRTKTLFNFSLFRITKNTYASNARAALFANTPSLQQFSLPELEFGESMEDVAQRFENWDFDGGDNQGLAVAPPQKPSPLPQLPPTQSTPLSEMAPSASHGFKTQMRHFGGKSKEWVQLKHDIKDSVIQQQWRCFTKGQVINDEQKKALKDSLDKKLEGKPAGQKRKAKEYLEAKLNKLPVVAINGNAALFQHQGKDGIEHFVRTESGAIFRIFNKMTPEIRARIQKQQGGKKYKGGLHLGRGNFGQVRLAEEVGRGGKIVAVKDAGSGGIDKDEDVKMKFSLINESSIYKDLPTESPHFSQTREYAHDLKKNKYLFMDLSIHGDLTKVKSKIDAVKDVEKRNKLKRTLAAQIITAVKELHKENIYHQDIKPANLLVSKEGNVVVTDFGVSVNKEDYKITDGSRFYEAPEANKDGSYISKGDKFSLGMTLRELSEERPMSKAILNFDNSLSSTSMFHHIRNVGHKRFIKKNEHRDVTALKGETLLEVALKLAAHNPEQRLDFDEVLDLPYFKDATYDTAQLAKFLNGETDWDTIKA